MTYYLIIGAILAAIYLIIFIANMIWKFTNLTLFKLFKNGDFNSIFLSFLFSFVVAAGFVIGWPLLLMVIFLNSGNLI